MCKRNGFEKNQYIAAKHIDTGHLHLHIVANRIGFDGRTVSDSNNCKKIAAYCRKMELKYDLKQVLSPRLFLSKEQRLIPRHDKRKEQIKTDIKNSLLVCRNYNEFERLMKEKRYEVIKGRGIAFIDEKKVYLKGSELGYSLKTIERILEQNRLNVSHQNMLHQRQHMDKLTVDLQPFSNKNDMTENHKSNELSKAMTDLLKPEENNAQLPYELRHSRKRKKGLRPH